MLILIYVVMYILLCWIDYKNTYAKEKTCTHKVYDVVICIFEYF